MIIIWQYWPALISAAFCCYFLHELLWIKKRRRLPPGPKGLPILGNLHQLGKNPHQDLCKLAKKHGPIMHMKFGTVPAIVVSSPEAAEKFLKTYDQVFASRPHHEGSWHLGYEQRNLTFSPYGPYWRKIRQLCNSHLLSNKIISSFESMRRAEVGLLVESLKRVASDGAAVDFSTDIRSLGANMSCLMIFGKKYLDKDFKDKRFGNVVRESLEISALINLGDYFPLVRVLDLQGFTRRFKKIAKVYDDLLEKIIDDHVNSQDQNETKDFVDILMDIMESGKSEFDFDRRHVKAILLDMLIASMDSTMATVEWTLSELIRHPQTMKKLQKEIEDKVGNARILEESDLEGLVYLDMVVKESMRLHPVATLGLPHESLEDCIVDGFHLEKRTRLIINIWAIGRDPCVWTDPESFIPERFLGSSVDLQGHDFKLIPFGFGRRSCPGLQLALTVMRFVLAQLVHCFDWKLADNVEPSHLDMSETFGIVTSRAKSLKVVPIYRLQK
ncbi:OLC1v1009095C1 [Oldenlandia corymbosa var. corymbosa]|uniref:OLC1v1009095C1 n=1 Tax=Oldenlandia corymbosa var. corymbosa TaxID=529605 RepID=A0AAV1DRA9_OLDCO|nr:OLC1v1009095C1 [Oldenlandia corymbosa var. corymbosa]